MCWRYRTDQHTHTNSFIIDVITALPTFTVASCSNNTAHEQLNGTLASRSTRFVLSSRVVNPKRHSEFLLGHSRWNIDLGSQNQDRHFRQRLVVQKRLETRWKSSTRIKRQESTTSCSRTRSCSLISGNRMRSAASTMYTIPLTPE